MAFDPNAATARYIDSLGPAALQKAHDYTVGKEWMLLWSFLVTALVTWLIVRSRILDRIEARMGARRPNLVAFVVALVFTLVSTILTGPGRSTRIISGRRPMARRASHSATTWGRRR